MTSKENPSFSEEKEAKRLFDIYIAASAHANDLGCIGILSPAKRARDGVADKPLCNAPASSISLMIGCAPPLHRWPTAAQRSPIRSRTVLSLRSIAPEGADKAGQDNGEEQSTCNDTRRLQHVRAPLPERAYGGHSVG
jgi:hypothetical protein